MTDLEKTQLKKEFLEEQANRLLQNPVASEFYYYYQELNKLQVVLEALKQKQIGEHD